MRYETPIFLGVVTLVVASSGTVLLAPPANCQQHVSIQSPPAQAQPAVLTTQSQTAAAPAAPSTVTPAQSVASITPPQAAATQMKSAESTPAQKALDPLTAAMAALPASLSTLARREFETAFRKLPSFCQDWQSKLHEREINNLANLAWQQKNAYETATYVGYGKVDGCLCKESAEGVPIGKVTYDEYQYYLVGKTLNEAKVAKPKLTGTTRTLEIFSWDKEQWFY
jgi:hypothetical protein